MTRPVASTASSTQPENTSQCSQVQQPSQTNVTMRPRPRPPHTQSAPNLSAITSDKSKPSIQDSPQLKASASAPIQSTEAPERPALTREYTAHLPYNPSRPPPHTYTRQHEFPPFPPLAQHPVLPFLTTAFSNQAEPKPTPLPPPKARPAIAPRVSTTQRHVHSNISTIPTMDVSRNDPTATFIRPPLVVPLSRNADPSIDPATLSGIIMDGDPVPGTPLTYAILHTHRNWFLDADDFCKDNPHRLDYPHDLEPPRGWAPLSECTGAGAANRCKQAKEKKEKSYAVRTKGSYAHGENAITDTTVEYGPSDDCHEKTVLRCTFCRREYHGPNAKSMWRRHVFDKHKVAMKNRREGSAGMAPKVPLPKKGKNKAAGPSKAAPPLGPPVDLNLPALTLDLSNEENIIRLLESVVSGNLDINLPASLLNPSLSCGDGSSGLNFEAIALALHKSGISLAVEGGAASGSHLATSSGSNVDSSNMTMKTEDRHDAGEDQRLKRDIKVVKAVIDLSLGMTDEMSPPHAAPSPAVVEDVANAIWATDSDSTSETSPSTFRKSTSSSSSLKRKAEGAERDEPPLAPSVFDRVPLRDNTVLARNNYNSDTRAIPNTPRRDKGKQRALPSTPGAPKTSQESFVDSPPSPRNPYTPLRHPSTTALRSRALATTGEESYLTLVLSSPASTSPIPGTGRVSFTSPFHRRISPTKGSNRDYPPTSDDVLGGLGTSSPRYPFEFNIQGVHSSPSYLSAFEPIPLELGSLGPAHWTPPALGPAAPRSEPTSRSISRASSVGDDVDVDENDEASDRDDDKDMELEYPERSSPEERLQYYRMSGLETSGFRARDDDFDMEAFLDFEDAGPDSDPDITSCQPKIISGRGLQFSKEFGLLSPEEVERITASARPTFEDQARSSKRRRLEVAS